MKNARKEGDFMPYTGDFDFFYGMESERYNFITIPKLLMKDERFNHISAEAKLMYDLFLDRNSLSQKNGWLDEENRVYIIYTIEEIKKDLGCATEKVNKVLKELESIGLIYRKRNGKRKANYIYVMDYMAIYRNANEAVKSVIGNAMNFENRKSCFSKNENHSEFRKSKGNKICEDLVKNMVITSQSFLFIKVGTGDRACGIIYGDVQRGLASAEPLVGRSVHLLKFPQISASGTSGVSIFDSNQISH